MLMPKYTLCQKIGEGSFSEVFLGKTYPFTKPRFVAVKCLHPFTGNIPANTDDVPLEVTVLRSLNPHPQIIQLIDSFYDAKTQRHCIVTELMEHNLYEYAQRVHRGTSLPESIVRILMWQLFQALSHLHQHNYFHRDVKPENLFVHHYNCGNVPTLKLGDFGGAKEITATPPFTDYIATRWYRAPECLMTCGYYSAAMDLWGAGCVMYELLAGKPLFPGLTEVHQIQCIESLCGPLPSYKETNRHLKTVVRSGPSNALLRSTQSRRNTFVMLQEQLPGSSNDAINVLIHLLSLDPVRRTSADQAMHFSFFNKLRWPFYKKMKWTCSVVSHYMRSTKKQHWLACMKRGNEKMHTGLLASIVEGQDLQSRENLKWGVSDDNAAWMNNMDEKIIPVKHITSSSWMNRTSPKTLTSRNSSRQAYIFVSSKDSDQPYDGHSLSFLETQATVPTRHSFQNNLLLDASFISSNTWVPKDHVLYREEESLTSDEIHLFMETLHIDSKNTYKKNSRLQKLKCYRKIIHYFSSICPVFSKLQ